MNTGGVWKITIQTESPDGHWSTWTYLNVAAECCHDACEKALACDDVMPNAASSAFGCPVRIHQAVLIAGSVLL